MEFKDIFNLHLGQYVATGAKVAGRLNFLTLLFLDLRRNSIDVEEYKDRVQSTLKLKFNSKMLGQVYEMCLIRDITKAISLTAGESAPSREDQENTDTQVEDFPDDVPNIDREAFKNRKAVIDYEFLKSVGYEE